MPLIIAEFTVIIYEKYGNKIMFYYLGQDVPIIVERENIIEVKGFFLEGEQLVFIITEQKF